MPTLGEMIEAGQRVLIVAEHMSGGAPWYLPTYGPFQETVFNFRRPSQMSCAPNRGSAGNPLFLLNHWINSDPKPLPETARSSTATAFCWIERNSVSQSAGASRTWWRSTSTAREMPAWSGR